MKLANGIIGALISVASLGVSSQTLAGDWKSIPGAGCQAYFGSQESDINKQANGAYNRATSSRWVSCLNVRDNVFNLSGTLGEWLYIVQGANDTTYCYLRANNPDGTSVESDANNRRGSGWIFLDTAKSSYYGAYVKYCLLPPRARISTVLLHETPNTTTQ